jgi:hypothetical protein
MITKLVLTKDAVWHLGVSAMKTVYTDGRTTKNRFYLQGILGPEDRNFVLEKFTYEFYLNM